MKKTKETRTLFLQRYLDVVDIKDIGMVVNFFSWFISTYLKMIEDEHELYNSIYAISYGSFNIQSLKNNKWFSLFDWDTIDTEYVDGCFTKFTIGKFSVIMNND